MPRPLKVFLCHAHSDKDTVKALYARLKREGVDVWLDKEKLLPGADWEYEIRKAVRESDVVIVCLSKQFNQAGFRQKEVRIALEEADKKPEGEIFIIPARLEECDNLESLSRWHWVDLFESDGFQRLILALRIRADKIGATLRQRGATTSHQKKIAEQQDTEKERIEQARREEEERERQRLAKEQADRDAAEKAERERLAREAKEKIEREKIEQERLERVAIEKAERERLDREAAEKTEHKNASKQIMEESAAMRAVVRRRAPAPKLNARTLGIGGVVFACLLLAIFSGNYFIKNINSAPTENTPIVIIPTSTKTKTPAPTQTRTPVPPTLTPTPGIGSTKNGEDGMTLVFVPAGEFTIGSDIYPDEQPIHQVILDDFWIDQTEITNAMYAKCVTDGDCEPPSSSSSYTHESYYGNSTYDDYPVIYVSWSKAAAYCKWAGRRLPTEAEWEKAARGTDGRTYPWGEEISCDIANYSGCIGDTTEIGSYPGGVSIYGALDMAGNVWEWVNDWYSDTYYKSSPLSNPPGPSSGQYRVLRGGSWGYSDDYVRSANRNWGVPADSSYFLGFRCSLSHP